jgi:hypothetical protein
MWSVADIVHAVATGLDSESARLETEQAVYGLDTNDELAFHRLIAKSLEVAGYGVFREQRYPDHRFHKNRRAGIRCDLVLTPRGRALAAPGEARTLFDPPDPVALQDAFWIEVKAIAQFTTAGPNRRYSSLYAAVRRDVAKLINSPGIPHKALLILLFTQDGTVADHDLEVWETQCAAQGLNLGVSVTRTLPIADRLGNSVCKLGCYPVSRVLSAKYRAGY